MTLVTSGQEWSFEKIDTVFEEIEKINAEKYQLDIYSNQLEVITYEQMLDAYAAVGLPVFYPHWSFGEQFVKEMGMYKKGYMGLAYEIVINSNPCIAYLMEENTMLMQTLVIAHACFGHNYFFKNNYLFKQWTDADGIIDYLLFAKRYVRSCEEKYGYDIVEATLDAAHALQRYGVDKYKRPPALSSEDERARQRSNEEYIRSQMNDVWRRTVPTDETPEDEQVENFPKDPQENLIKFIEKNAPKLEEWQREILRIVRRVAQYFYPQGQTKLMNEGCATYFHYNIMHDLHKAKVVDDGAMLEFYESHTGVVTQPAGGQINPYALGFAMMQDIERIAMEPTEEDRDWFGDQAWVGSEDYVGAIKYACENFKDESFIQQYLSPKIIREFRLFNILDDDEDPMYEVTAIHNKSGYEEIRDCLAMQYNIGYMLPDIQVINVDLWGDRSLTLQHNMVDRKPLDPEATAETLKHVSFLWGYDVKLKSVDIDGDVTAEYNIHDEETLIDLFMDDL